MLLILIPWGRPCSWFSVMQLQVHKTGEEVELSGLYEPQEVQHQGFGGRLVDPVHQSHREHHTLHPHDMGGGAHWNFFRDVCVRGPFLIRIPSNTLMISEWMFMGMAHQTWFYRIFDGVTLWSSDWKSSLASGHCIQHESYYFCLTFLSPLSSQQQWQMACVSLEHNRNLRLVLL